MIVSSSTSLGLADGVEAFSSFKRAAVYVGPELGVVVLAAMADTLLEFQSSEFPKKDQTKTYTPCRRSIQLKLLTQIRLLHFELLSVAFLSNQTK